MLYQNGQEAKALYWEGQPVKRVYVGTGTDAIQVWPAEVWEALTSTAYLGARSDARAAATSRGIDWATTQTVPFGLDCALQTSLEQVLEGWRNLTTIRVRNTGAVSTLARAFDQCNSLTAAPAMDTSKVTRMYATFRNCSALVEAPAWDASAVTEMGNAFDGCYSMTSIGLYGQRVSFSVLNTQLGTSALNALFSQLGTAQPGATLTITGTPGAATCDRSIATAKGWTITG